MNTLFTNRSYDPFFSASRRKEIYQVPGQFQLWAPDQPGSALACVEQYAACGTDDCTIPGGYYQVMNQSSLKGLKLNDRQRAILRSITDVMFGSRLRWFDYTLEDEYLLAKNHLRGFMGHTICMD